METPGMARRLSISLVLAGALAALGAGRYRTANFVVDAPTEQAAKEVAEYAEVYRKEKAVQWLGREMPQWPAPCPIKVTIQVDGAGGATTFEYGPEGVERQHMHIEGRYDRLLNSVLPHEITHTVFAYYYRCPVPRWADEGGSVLSEDQPERTRHDQLAKSILNTPGRLIPLRRLFALKEYPDDVMSLYAEGYSRLELPGQPGRREGAADVPQLRRLRDAEQRVGRRGPQLLRLPHRERVGRGLGGQPAAARARRRCSWRRTTSRPSRKRPAALFRGRRRRRCR